MRLPQWPGAVLSATTPTTISAIPKTWIDPTTSFQITNPKRSRLLLPVRQEIDDDPGVEAPVVGAWQDGELRVGESPSQGEGVLYGDLLVAIADHDQRRSGIPPEVVDREGRLLAMPPVELPRDRRCGDAERIGEWAPRPGSFEPLADLCDELFVAGETLCEPGRSRSSRLPNRLLARSEARRRRRG